MGFMKFDECLSLAYLHMRPNYFTTMPAFFSLTHRAHLMERRHLVTATRSKSMERMRESHPDTVGDAGVTR